MQIDNILRNCTAYFNQRLFIAYFFHYLSSALRVFVFFIWQKSPYAYRLNWVYAFLLLHRIAGMEIYSKLIVCHSNNCGYHYFNIYTTILIDIQHTHMTMRLLRFVFPTTCVQMLLKNEKQFPFSWSKKSDVYTQTHTPLTCSKLVLMMSFRSSSGYRINRAIMVLCFNSLCPIKVDYCIHFSTSMTPLVCTESASSSSRCSMSWKQRFIHLEC